MSRIITVTPAELESAAGKIENMASDYKAQFDKFYQVTADMAATWNGKDNMAFINQIDGFRDDFNKMYDLMNNYVAFLRNSAASYRSTQDDVENTARRLQN